MLRLHKLRAFLTMLGVIIGVMSVTLIVMLSQGFRDYIDTEFKKLGADTLFITTDMTRRMRGQTRGAFMTLVNEDVELIRDKCSKIDIISPVSSPGAMPIKYEEKEIADVTVYGTDENYNELNRFGIDQGRALTASDIRLRSNVCLIGIEIRDTFFGKADPIGKLVNAKGITLEVVGVMEKLDMGPMSTGKMMIVPITTVQDKWIGGRRLQMISMRPKPGIPVPDAMQEVWEVMMQKSNNRPIYRVDSRESIMNVFGNVIGIAGIVLGSIAALSLLVGGIGIMNIMLVSVTERTREIGLRKAVGAKRLAILTQFLVEAAVLSVAGGLIGMGLALGIGKATTAITAKMGLLSGAGIVTSFPVWAAVFAVGFSALIGMIFGIYPAWSAAKLDPIVALRSE